MEKVTNEGTLVCCKAQRRKRICDGCVGPGSGFRLVFRTATCGVIRRHCVCWVVPKGYSGKRVCYLEKGNLGPDPLTYLGQARTGP